MCKYIPVNNFVENSFVLLAVVLAFIAIAVVEFRSELRSVRRYRAQCTKHTSSVVPAEIPELYLSRPFNFLLTCAGSADAALLTLFALDMLNAGNLDSNPVILGLPLMCGYVAYQFSGPLRLLLVRLTSLRACFIVGAAGMLISFGFVAVSVMYVSLAFYIATLLINRLFYYVTVSCVRLLSTIASSEKECIDLNVELDNSDISASCIIGLICGFAAQYIGNASVYVLAAIPCATVLLLFVWFIPKNLDEHMPHVNTSANNVNAASNTVNEQLNDAEDFIYKKKQLSEHYSAHSNKEYIVTEHINKRANCISFSSYTNEQSIQPKGGRKKTLHLRAFLLHPSTIALFVFALNTLGFSACYRSYLFPIFADVAGLDKAAISTITVFCNAAVFLISPLVARISHKSGSDKLLVCMLAICGISYIGFLFLDTNAWSIIALFLLVLIKRVGGPLTRAIWPDVADACRLNRSAGQTIYETADGFTCIFKIPLTSALMLLGSMVTCAIFGAYSFISAVGYLIAVRVKHD